MESTLFSEIDRLRQIDIENQMLRAENQELHRIIGGKMPMVSEVLLESKNHPGLYNLMINKVFVRQDGTLKIIVSN